MARGTLLAAALTLVACGGIGLPGGNSALCNSGINASIKISNELAACEGKPQTMGDVTSAAIAACSVAITGCSAADQSTLTTEYNCIQNLPPYQCAWLDAGVNPDAGRSQWEAQQAMCTPAKPVNCSAKF